MDAEVAESIIEKSIVIQIQEEKQNKINITILITSCIVNYKYGMQNR